MEKTVGVRGDPKFTGIPLGRAAATDSHTTTSKAPLHCFHCGEPCLDDSIAKAEKTFCCRGCLLVHDLLSEAGLTQFYELGSHPGIRVKARSDSARWSYLDEPGLSERLLDFTDGKNSRVTFHVPAIHCVACVWLLENLFRLHPGIGKSLVNFPRREVSITFAADGITLSQVAGLLASIGYEPNLTLGDVERQPADAAWKRRWLQIGVAGFAFGNIMLFSIPGYLGMDSFSQPLFKSLFGYLSLLLAFPVLLYCAADYWRSAWLSIRQRALTLDVPIALGLAALYLQSAGEILTGRGEGYLDSLAGLVFFLLCGRAFQHKTFDRIAFDRDYKCFFPLSVLRKTAEGETTVAISELAVGDRLVLRNGELIPADCRLVQGKALVDYSFVTGESAPVAKTTGDYLYAGGRQAGTIIEVETVKPVSQSYLTSLWSHEAFQKERHDRLNTLTNRYSRRFTRLVIGVALAAAFCWFIAGDPSRAIKAFTSVLIVACPCALALAAPFALGTAQRLLAEFKIFLKHSLVLERMAEVNTVVFDKTGTLTSDNSITTEFRADDHLNEQERNAVWSLARHSTHPYSIGICSRFSHTADLPVREFAEVPGCGIRGEAAGRHVLIGSRSWLEQNGIVVPHHDESSGSRSWVSIDGAVRGHFAFSSQLRPKSDTMLRDLAGNYELALLSGDNARDKVLFRELFGSEARLWFNQSPVDKLGFIKKLQESGRTVLMAGDGLNDAGALRQSDVGVAVVEKIGAFSPASDIILEAGRIPELGKLLQLAQSSARIVRISFGISAIYNLAGVSIAAAGILSPVICAVLMPLSSVSVVLFACVAVKIAARKLHFVPDTSRASRNNQRERTHAVGNPLHTLSPQPITINS